MDDSALGLKQRLGLAGSVPGEAERSEADGASVAVAGAAMRAAADPEVSGRRRFSAAYKARIVREADACAEPREIGALLRREGLCSAMAIPSMYGIRMSRRETTFEQPLVFLFV